MAVERLTVLVDSKGARVVKRELDGVAGAAGRAGAASKLLSRALAAIGSGLLVRGLVRMNDGFIGVQNRIKLVTKGMDELQSTTKSLQKIATDTRTNFNLTGEVFGRVALATKNLGISTQQTLKFTESLNKAVKISGGNAQEAKNALIQLGQGLASGALRGDELRSVLEQLPRVSQVLEDSLGVTRGELRKLAEDGRITAETVINAFNEMGAELDEEFSRLTPTIGESIENLKTGLTFALAEFEKSTGIFEKSSKAILFLSKNMDILVNIVQKLAIALGTTVLVKALLGAAAAFGRLKKALIAFQVFVVTNPFLALAAGAIVAIGALVAFRKELIQIGIEADILRGRKDQVALSAEAEIQQEFVDNLLKGAKKVNQEVKIGNALIKARVNTLEDVEAAAIAANLAVASGALDDAILARTAQRRRELAVIQEIKRVTEEQIQRDLALAEAERIKRASRAGGKGKDKRFGEFRDLQNELNPILAAQRELAAAEDLIVFAVEKRLITDAKAIDLRNQKIEAIRDQLEPGEALLEQIKAETKAIQQGGKLRERDIRLQEIEAQLSKAKDPRLRENLELIKEQLKLQEQTIQARQAEEIVQKEYNDALSAADAIVKQSQTPLQQMEAQIETLRTAMILATGDTTKYEEAIDRIIKKIAETEAKANAKKNKQGDKGPLAQLLGQSTEVSTAMEKSFVSAFNNISDALTRLVVEGKFSFRDLGASIAASISQILIKMALLRAVQFAFGVPSTGVFSGGIPGLATGGAFQVGGSGGTDSQLVAFRATPGEQVSVNPPNKTSPEGGSPMALKVVNVVDPAEAVNAMRGEAGEEVILNAIGRNAGQVRSLIGG